jgi:hypothetical protein
MAELTLKDRLSALSNLPQFFKLVWQTNRTFTIINAILRLLRSAIPVAVLYVGKLIVDQVVLISQGAVSPHTWLWQLVAVELALAVLSDALGRATTLVDSLLGELFSNHTSVKIMAHAATLDLEQFEDTTFYDKLERARQQTIGRTILLSQVLSQVQDLITMAFLAAGLFVFNPWLLLLLFVAVLPSFLGESYFNDKNYTLSRRQTPQRRELDYYRYIGASDETAKEVKLLIFPALSLIAFAPYRVIFTRTINGWQCAALYGVQYFPCWVPWDTMVLMFLFLPAPSMAVSPSVRLLFLLAPSASFAACWIVCCHGLRPFRRALFTSKTSSIFSR